MIVIVNFNNVFYYIRICLCQRALLYTSPTYPKEQNLSKGKGMLFIVIKQPKLVINRTPV
jgi:hypothetical protein